MQRARGDVTQQWKPQQNRDNYARKSEACFLCVVCVEILWAARNVACEAVQEFSRRKSEVGKLVVEELKFGLWRLSVWLEDLFKMIVL
jgi:hypothetical protein